MINYAERDTRQNLGLSILSVLILTLFLFILGLMKSEPKELNSIFHLSNLGSIEELGHVKTSTEPILYLLFFLFKKISFLSLEKTFLFFSTLLLSIFLHQSMYLFKKESWELNHYLSVYLLSFIPIHFHLPFIYLQELLCGIFILMLFTYTRLDSIENLLLVFFISVLSFLTSLTMFLYFYTIYVVLSSFFFMQKQKSKTTVFYKRKNIAGRILLAYLILFSIVLFYFGYTKFFGEQGVSYLFSKFLSYSYRFLVPFILSFVCYYLLENEKEFHNKITSMFAVILILVMAYLSYIQKSDISEKSEKDFASLNKFLDLGKIPKGQNVYSSKLISDLIFLKTKHQVFELDYLKLKKEDYFFVESNLTIEKILFDKNYKPKFQPIYKLSESAYLVNKDFSDKIYSEKNPLNSYILQEIERSQKKYSTYDSYKHYLSNLFGYEKPI